MPAVQRSSSRKQKKSIEKAATSLTETAATANDPQVQRYAVFKVGNQRYAIDVDRIIEVLHQFTVEPVSHLPDSFPGVIHLRGVSVPVVDLSILLREERTGTDGKTCLIAMMEKEHIGLLIDSDTDIITSRPGMLHALPDSYTKEEAQFIEGILALSDDLMAIIDPAGIVRTLTDWKVPDAKT